VSGDSVIVTARATGVPSLIQFGSIGCGGRSDCNVSDAVDFSRPIPWDSRVVASERTRMRYVSAIDRSDRRRHVPDGVDVWSVHLDDVDEPRWKEWQGWLAPDEQRKQGRFATKHLKREYLVTRALSRWALSQYTVDIAPAEWIFERTDAGRPIVVGPCEAPSFNLSNAGGLVVCAVSSYPIGIDVEPSSRGEEILANATKLFSDRENANLRSLPEKERATDAVELWTLKEAYLKARGEGISVHTHRFGVASSFSSCAYPRPFDFEGDNLDQDAEAWCLEVHALEPGYIVALAKRAPELNPSFQPGLGVVPRPIFSGR
jgi:4'-phosphopantetheinyl transferase